LLYGGFAKGSAVNREEEGEKIHFAELPERTIPRDAVVMIVAQEANNGEAGCRTAASEPISLSGGAPALATNLSNSTTSGESAQASTSGTVHTHAAETCIGNRQQETYVTIASKTPYPQDLTKDPLARRPRTTTPTTTTSVIIDTKTPYLQDLIKDATARRPKTKTPTTSTPSTLTMNGGKEGPAGSRPEVGCGRDGRLRMTALVNSRAEVLLLGSASAAWGR
jgi:hypothetical protein